MTTSARKLSTAYTALVERDKSTRRGGGVEILVRFRVDDPKTAADFLGSLHHSDIRYLGIAESVVSRDRLVEAQSLIRDYESNAPRIVKRVESQSLNPADMLLAIETTGRYIAPDGQVWLSQDRIADEAGCSIATISRAANGRTKSAQVVALKLSKSRWAYLSGSYVKTRKRA